MTRPRHAQLVPLSAIVVMFGLERATEPGAIQSLRLSGTTSRRFQTTRSAEWPNWLLTMRLVRVRVKLQETLRTQAVRAWGAPSCLTRR